HHRDEGTRQRHSGSIERVSFSTSRSPEGVMVHPSAPQFSSSRATIFVCPLAEAASGGLPRRETNRADSSCNNACRSCASGNAAPLREKPDFHLRGRSL